MKEYIDLAEAKSKAVYMHGFGQAKFVSVANLEKCKAADVVERKRGEWEHRVESHHDTHTDEYWDEGYFVCSECGESWWDTTNFCPNCGADMRGEKHERD